MLATLAQLKQRLNVTTDGDVEDGLLVELLEAASERVMHAADRRFLPDPAVVDDDGGLIVPPPAPVTRTSSAFRSTWCVAHDLRQAVAIVADGIDVTSSTRLVARDGEPAHGLVLPCRADQVAITGHFGFAQVPVSIRDAALGWAQRAYHETRARMSDSIVTPDGGVVSYFRQVPPFVTAAVDHYRITTL